MQLLGVEASRYTRHQVPRHTLPTITFRGALLQALDIQSDQATPLEANQVAPLQASLATRQVVVRRAIRLIISSATLLWAKGSSQVLLDPATEDTRFQPSVPCLTVCNPRLVEECTRL